MHIRQFCDSFVLSLTDVPENNIRPDRAATVIHGKSVTHLLTEGDKLTRKGTNAMDATKNFQSKKAVALQETGYGESVPFATNVNTNPTFVSPASERSIKRMRNFLVMIEFRF